MKSLKGSHFIGSMFHCVNDSRDEGTGHVSDSHAYQLFIGIGCGVFAHAARYLGKQITSGQLLIVFVNHFNQSFQRVNEDVLVFFVGISLVRPYIEGVFRRQADEEVQVV